MLNLVRVVPVHRGRLFYVRGPWHAPPCLRLQLRLYLPSALIMSWGVKRRESTEQTKQALSCVCIRTHPKRFEESKSCSLIFLCLPPPFSRREVGENLLFTGDKQQKHSATHMHLYLNSTLRRSQTKRLALRVSDCVCTAAKKRMICRKKKKKKRQNQIKRGDVFWVVFSSHATFLFSFYSSADLNASVWSNRAALSNRSTWTSSDILVK